MRNRLKIAYLLFRGFILLIPTFAVVVAVRISLFCFKYQFIERFIPSARTQAAPAAMTGRVAWAVGCVAKFIPAASCLTQALSVQLILAIRGFSSEVRVGVVRDDAGGMRAHAWVISDDKIVIGGSSADIARYTPLVALPTRSR